MSHQNNDSHLNVKLVTAAHWMEADSIKNYLLNKGIEVYVPNRTSSGSLAGEVDLRLGGYSAVSSGFDVFVHPDQLEQAKLEYENWKKEIQSKDEEPTKDSEYYLTRFLRAILFSLFIPLVFHMAAIYHLVMYFKSAGRIFNVKLLLGIIYLVVTGLIIPIYLLIFLNQ